MYKLAIFDFDGTLVDSAPGIVEVMQLVVDEYKLSEAIFNEWKELVGIPLMRQMEIIFPERNEEFWLEVATRYRAIYDARAIELCPLFPGLIDMLDTLKSDAVKMSIASSKRRYLIEMVLNHYQLAKYFDLVVGAQDVNNHKPHPESVFITLEKLGVEPAQTVVTGDSSYDLDMANGAGVDAIGVLTGVHTREVLEKSRPLHIVNSLQEVLPIIRNGRCR